MASNDENRNSSSSSSICNNLTFLTNSKLNINDLNYLSINQQQFNLLNNNNSFLHNQNLEIHQNNLFNIQQEHQKQLNFIQASSSLSPRSSSSSISSSLSPLQISNIGNYYTFSCIINKTI